MGIAANGLSIYEAPEINIMKLKLEIEADDALELCRLHAAVQEIGVLNMADMPLTYSRMSRITNDFFAEVVKRLPMDEFERIKIEDDKRDAAGVL